MSSSPSMSENMRKSVANSLFCFDCLDLYAIMDIRSLFIYLFFVFIYAFDVRSGSI